MQITEEVDMVETTADMVEVMADTVETTADMEADMVGTVDTVAAAVVKQNISCVSCCLNKKKLEKISLIQVLLIGFV